MILLNLLYLVLYGRRLLEGKAGENFHTLPEHFQT
jgi:hypothetical protein